MRPHLVEPTPAPEPPRDAYAAPVSQEAKAAAFRIAGAAKRLETAVCGPSATTKMLDEAKLLLAAIAGDVRRAEGLLS